MKSGRTLELVVASLERALCGKENVRIVSPYKVADKTNAKHKRLREHDVVIVHECSHHRFLIALECRDRSRAVTREQVEAFSRKCQDTGIHKGVLVSAKGFRDTAKEKATFLEIECLTLNEVREFDWLLPGNLSQYESKLLKQNWLFIPEVDIDPKPRSFAILDELGNEVSFELLAANVRIVWEQRPNLVLKAGVHPLRAIVEMKRWQLLDKATGLKHNLKHAKVYAEMEVSERSVGFKKVRYANVEKGGEIAQAAIASIQAGPVSGELMMINRGKGIEVVFVPNQRAQGRDGLG